jgi:asparagine synthase (glutamine-hydrolysing)
MCGICGILNRDPDSLIDENRFLRMRDCMVHRGPDDAGVFASPGVALGTRRLAILDLSPNGHMPMCTPNGRFWITYNGEIYNYQSFYPELEAKGYRFHSTSDTEVLLTLYQEYGPAMLSRLNGMFAFAIWDTQERTLFMGRDRFGVKPFVYAHNVDEFLFASEEKALIQAGFRAEFDENSLEEFLFFRYISGERTPYKNIKRLLPGHYAFWKAGKLNLNKWFYPSTEQDTSKKNPSELADEFRCLFEESMRLRRISDVPLGALLSGGLDSGSMVAVMAQQAGSGVSSFTVRFREAYYDEGELAKQVADRYHLSHHEQFVDPAALPGLIREATRLLDTPIVHGNDIHILSISKYAKPRVTVLLSGEGSDEILAGYVKYRLFLYTPAFILLSPLARAAKNIISTNGRLHKSVRVLSNRSAASRIMFSSAEVFPGDYDFECNNQAYLSYRAYLTDQAVNLFHNPLRQVMFYEQNTYLQSVLDRNDRMTMGASIECREPFLDIHLTAWASRLSPNQFFHQGVGKYPLRLAMRNDLPQDILSHKKWGFSTPWQNYFRENAELREWVANIPDHPLMDLPPLNKKMIEAQVSKFLKGDNMPTALITQLLFLVTWHQVCIERK